MKKSVYIQTQNNTYVIFPQVPRVARVNKPIQAVPPKPKNIFHIEPNKTIQQHDQLTPEICIANIWKYCKKSDKCEDMHYYLPYRWQELQQTGWEDLPDMEKIEKAYCHPSNDGCTIGSGKLKIIDFQTMKSGNKPIRRLTTKTFVHRPRDYVFTTEWIWYWKDELDRWIEYGEQNQFGMCANVPSDIIEEYQDAPYTIKFSTGCNEYTLSCKEMKQKNKKTGTEREVRRRPKFLDFEDVKMLKGSTKKSAAHVLMKVVYPPDWDTEAMPNEGYAKVLVAKASNEFQEAVTAFNQTLPNFSLEKLWRVQNPSLWQGYEWQREQMKKKNSGKDVLECFLFHGTRTENVEAILSQNFDWRICGTNGTRFGQGSYFARDASMSHAYSLPTPGQMSSQPIWMMLMARVLVGDYAKGDSQMKRPPRKQAGGQSYDSCVDDPDNPSIVVIFEKLQIYPQYILEYKQQPIQLRAIKRH